MGGGKFWVISYASGPVYKTSDTWASVDSTPEILSHEPSVILGYFGYKGEDTLFSYTSRQEGSKVVTRLFRSLDGGTVWDEIHLSIDSVVSPGAYQLALSSPNNTPTFMGGGVAGGRSILRSEDHGMSWTLDSLAIDTAVPFYKIPALATSSHGYAVAVLEKGILARGEPLKLGVESYEQIAWNTRMYPNPTTDRITIRSVDQSRPVYLQTQ